MPHFLVNSCRIHLISFSKSFKFMSSSSKFTVSSFQIPAIKNSQSTKLSQYHSIQVAVQLSPFAGIQNAGGCRVTLQQEVICQQGWVLHGWRLTWKFSFRPCRFIPWLAVTYRFQTGISFRFIGIHPCCFIHYLKKDDAIYHKCSSNSDGWLGWVGWLGWLIGSYKGTTLFFLSIQVKNSKYQPTIGWA